MKTKPKTIRIHLDTEARLAALASRLESDQSPLIDKLLNQAMDAIDSGEWEVSRTPVRYVIGFGRPPGDRK